MKNKFNAKKTIVDGIKFDSQAEAKYYIQLKLKKEIGLIKDFSLQPRFELQPKFVKNGVTYRKIEYIADFLILTNDDQTEIVDVKGQVLEVFKIKRKLFEYIYPHLTLKIIKYKNNSFLEVNLDGTKKGKQTEKKPIKRTKGKRLRKSF